MASFTIPFNFNRGSADPLDASSVFATKQLREAFLTDETRYAGQVVFDQSDQKLYVLNTARNAWLEVGSESTGLSTGLSALSTLTFFGDLTGTALTDAVSALSGSLSAYNSIFELASAVKTLTDATLGEGGGEGGNFLTKNNPTIASGNLELAYAGGIKLSADGLPSSVFVVTSARQIIGSEFYAGSGTDASVKVTPAGLYASSTYYVGSGGDSRLGALTASSISLADNKFSIDGNGNVVIGRLSSESGEQVLSNLTVTGNLSVLGAVTYLDTEVQTLSTTLVTLSADTSTGLKVTQTGIYNIVEFINGSGDGLTINKDGDLTLSGGTAAFLSSVDVSGKLTVNADISSSQTVYASAGLFSTSLEVGNQGDDTVLYVNASGVGINTETLDGYSLKVSGDANSGNGTLYVTGSATLNSNIAVTGPAVFNSTVSVLSSTSVVELTGSGSTRACSLTGDTQVVTWGSMWTYISALDGGSF